MPDGQNQQEDFLIQPAQRFSFFFFFLTELALILNIQNSAVLFLPTKISILAITAISAAISALLPVIQRLKVDPLRRPNKYVRVPVARTGRQFNTVTGIRNTMGRANP